MTLEIIFHKADEGGFWAELPGLPGCVTQGETLEDINANIREAIKLWLEIGNEVPHHIDENDLWELNG